LPYDFIFGDFGKLGSWIKTALPRFTANYHDPFLARLERMYVDHVNIACHRVCAFFEIHVLRRRLEPNVMTRKKSFVRKVVVYNLLKNIFFHSENPEVVLRLTSQLRAASCGAASLT
jgi:hypothetical protein